jgi:hypothetical protein
VGIIEQKFVGRLAELNLSRAVLSQLTDIREQHLCPALRCSETLSGLEIQKIDYILMSIERLTKIARPFDIPIDDVKLLTYLADGDLDGILAPVAKEIVAVMEASR